MKNKFYKFCIYRGIPEATTICTGDPSTKYSKSPTEKGFYDLYQIIDKHFSTINYEWEKSHSKSPEVFYWGQWHHATDANYQ